VGRSALHISRNLSQGIMGKLEKFEIVNAMESDMKLRAKSLAAR
jgi:hypothetical protein